MDKDKEKDVEIENVKLLKRTEKAIRCKVGSQIFWLPKSQIALVDEKDNIATVIMPGWLAGEKGL